MTALTVEATPVWNAIASKPVKRPPEARVPREFIRFFPSMQDRVLLALISFRNGKTGQCNPPIALIAEVADGSEPAVEKALRRLRAKNIIGWTMVRAGKRSDPRRHFTINGYSYPHSGSSLDNNLPDSAKTTTPIGHPPYKVRTNYEITNVRTPEIIKEDDQEMEQAIGHLVAVGANRAQLEKRIEAGHRDLVLEWHKAFDDIDWDKDYKWADSPIAVMLSEITKGRQPKVSRRASRIRYKTPEEFEHEASGSLYWELRASEDAIKLIKRAFSAGRSIVNDAYLSDFAEENLAAAEELVSMSWPRNAIAAYDEARYSHPGLNLKSFLAGQKEKAA